MLNSIRNTIQSSCFLASSAAAFQALMCSKSALFDSDWKYSYWLMGALAGGAGVLIEKKPRRSELALYVSRWNLNMSFNAFSCFQRPCKPSIGP